MTGDTDSGFDPFDDRPQRSPMDDIADSTAETAQHLMHLRSAVETMEVQQRESHALIASQVDAVAPKLDLIASRLRYAVWLLFGIFLVLLTK